MLKEGTISQLIMVIIFIIGTYYYTTQGEKGKDYYIRRIAGVDALDEALERATELGGAIHYAVGDKAELKGEYFPQVLAGMECLGHIARHCARLDTKLIVTLSGRRGSSSDLVPFVRETVRTAYDSEGKLDDFTDDVVRFVSGERTGYETAIPMIFKTENVVTNVMIGPWAGSMLVPSGVSAAEGIVLITGTARLVQMPYQACLADYFMVGEEIFAAGALLSGDAMAKATLRFSDITKIASIVLILVGAVVGVDFMKQILQA
jgi:hypothetical protein